MTIAAQNNRIAYAGNGVTTAFSYPSKFLANGDLVVILTSAAGVETVKTLTTHYTITGAGDANGGTVTMLTAPASGETLVIYGDPAVTQPVDLVEGEALPVETQVEAPLDRLTLIARRLKDRLDRAIQLPEGDTSGADMTLPSPSERASLYLAFNADGELSLLPGEPFEIPELNSVTTYDGVVGDGVTDCSAGFIAADNANAGDIYVPDGTFVVEGITLTDKKMWGPGTLKWKAASVVNLMTLSGRAVLDGVKFDGDAANQSGTTIAIVTDTAPYAEIKGCYFTNFRYKVFVTDVAASPYGKIAGNTFEDNGTVGSCSQAELRSPYWIVQGNHFEDIGDGHCIRVGLFSGDATSTPVTGTVIKGNIFKDTEHVGVTLELYAQHTTITGNTFDTLEQAIKCEAGTGDVFDAVVTGNTIKNISATTALALNVPGVVFTGNSCFTLAGPCSLGDNAVCSGNFFDTCGTASTQVAISQTSSFEGVAITGNTVINSPFRAISIAGGKATVTGNFIFNTTDAAIRTSAEDTVIVGNVVDTALVGIAATSAAGRYVIRDNILTTCTTTISVIDNATSATSFVGENVGYVGATHTYTIASGVAAISTTAKDVRVDTESAAGTDDLDTISGGYTGQIIAVRGVSAARVVTVKDATGNLLTAGDFALDATADTLLLMFDGTNWRQIGGSNNA